jgi:hypothetical protein
MDLPAGGLDDLIDTIRLSHGGGQYLIQPRIRKGPSGKQYFAQGSAIITIAGEPMLSGRPYRNGRLVDDPPPQQQQQLAPQVITLPAPQHAGDLQSQLLGMIGKVIGANSGGGSMDFAGIASLIGAVSKLSTPPPTPQSQIDAADPFGAAERLIAFAQKLARVQNPASAVNVDSASGLSPDSLIEKVLLEKVMGGMFGGTPQPQPQPQQPQRMPPPPPGWAWDPARGWIPTAPPPPAPPPTAAPPAPPADAETTPAGEWDEGEPLTADEVVAELGSMEPAAAASFVASVLGRLSPDLQDRLLGSLATPQPSDTVAQFPAPISLGGHR